jgi:hypothetical protein
MDNFVHNATNRTSKFLQYVLVGDREGREVERGKVRKGAEWGREREGERGVDVGEREERRHSGREGGIRNRSV